MRVSPATAVVVACCALAGAAATAFAMAAGAMDGTPAPPVPAAPASDATPIPDRPGTGSTDADVVREGVAVRPLVHGAHVRDADTMFDWQSVPAAETFSHVFVLHNDGDQALHIVRAHPS
jgi:hypothetical protein